MNGSVFGKVTILLALLAAGLIAVKVLTTPEVIRVVNGELHYFQGSAKHFKFKSCDVENISFIRNLETYHNKLLGFYFKDGSEYSVPYKYLSDIQLDELIFYYKCYVPVVIVFWL